MGPILKILHLASGDAWGGAERSLAHLAAAQRRSGPVEALLFNEGRLASTLRAADVPVRIVPEQGHSLLELVRSVRAQVKAGGFDVVHAHRYKEIVIASLSCGDAGIPFQAADGEVRFDTVRYRHRTYRGPSLVRLRSRLTAR